MAIKLPRMAKGPLHLVLYSSGLKTYGESEWCTRKHGKWGRHSWRMLHRAVNEASGKIQALVLSSLELDDAGAVKELLKAISTPIQQLSGDGDNDKRKVYTWAHEQGLKRFAIPPQKRARSWKTAALTKGEGHPHDHILAWISRVGRKKWKRSSGYYRQSMAENAIFRFKTIFGSKLRSRKLAQQITEARIKGTILNRIAQLGMPDSCPVLAS